MITDISTFDAQSRTKSRLGLKKKKVNAIRENAELAEGKALNDLMTYQNDWDNLSDFRYRYKRATKYLRGDQWSDYIQNDDGEYVTEEDYITEQGKIPLKQNIIRPIVKSLSGLFRTDRGKSIVISTRPNTAKIEKMLSNALQYALHINDAREIDSRTFELFMLSGLPVQKVGYDFISEYGRYDVVIDYIDPNYIFFNGDIKDIRLTDLRRIGQIHDITLDELFVHFAQSEKDKEKLKLIYAPVSKDEFSDIMGLDPYRSQNLDFYIPHDLHKCRVIEVWEKRATNVIDYWDMASGEEGYWDGTAEDIERLNLSRKQKYIMAGIPEDEWALIEYGQTIAFKWFYRYLSPYGHILREGESPYQHGSHPYEMYPYPLVSGEVWGIVEDIIDQQRYLNRLVTLWDSVIGTSSKNTLILDKNTMDGQSPEQIGATYREVGGVLVLDLKNGGIPPQTVNDRAVNLGVTELIGMQLKWIQDISGVQPAMQGQQGGSGTPASRYAMELNQATLNSRDFMESYNAFRRRRDMKVLKTLMQFYKGQRYVALGGEGTNDEQVYDSEIAKDYINAFDIRIGQSTDSPAYKGWVDEMLKELVLQGLIDVEMFFKHSNFPFSEAMLEEIKNKREQMVQGQISPNEAATQVNNKYVQQPGVDPNKIAQIAGMVQK